MDDQDLFPMGEEPGYAESQEEFSYPRSVVAGVLVLSVLVLVVVFWQMKTNLRLDIPNAGKGISSQREGGSLLDLEDVTLRGQDSDEDGLSDYDELRVYGSSPFIADSDSDGISDAEEIALGEDPNCAKGTSCFIGLAEATDTKTVAPSFFASEDVQEVIDDPAAIRRLLLQNGADPQLVNSLDDQTLQILAQESFQSFQQPTQESIDLLSSLDPAQLRSVLLEVGLSKADLDAIDDDKLLEIFQQVAQEEESKLKSQNPTNIETE